MTGGVKDPAGLCKDSARLFRLKAQAAIPGTSEQGKPVGALVIRQQGRWVPVELSTSVVPGDSRGRMVPLR